MNTAKTSPQARQDNDAAWFSEGAVANAREDRVAEAVALVALLFSLCIGLVIALLPVPARAAPAPGAPSLQLQASDVVPNARRQAGPNNG